MIENCLRLGTHKQHKNIHPSLTYIYIKTQTNIKDVSLSMSIVCFNSVRLYIGTAVL